MSDRSILSPYVKEELFLVRGGSRGREVEGIISPTCKIMGGIVSSGKFWAQSLHDPNRSSEIYLIVPSSLDYPV